MQKPSVAPSLGQNKVDKDIPSLSAWQVGGDHAFDAEIPSKKRVPMHWKSELAYYLQSQDSGVHFRFSDSVESEPTETLAMDMASTPVSRK